MKRFLGPLVALAVVVLVAGGSVVLASSDGPYAFKVDGHATSQSDFDRQLEVLHQHPVLLTGDETTAFPLAGSLPGDIGRTWLQLRIQASIASDELRRMGERIVEADRTAVGYPDTGAFAKVPNDLRRVIIDDAAALNVFQRVLVGDTQPADAEIAAQLATVCPSGRYVAHILVESQTIATAIKRDLDRGGDFAQLATANSIDTGSAADGGRVGCVDTHQFVEPFQTVARTLPVGAVSDPVQTEYGWHLIVVRPNDPTATEVEDAQTALQDAAQAVASAAIAKVLQRIHVEIDPRYGRWDSKTGQVLPPKAQTG
jgi:hypothetical protein